MPSHYFLNPQGGRPGSSGFNFNQAPPPPSGPQRPIGGGPNIPLGGGRPGSIGGPPTTGNFQQDLLEGVLGSIEGPGGLIGNIGNTLPGFFNAGFEGFNPSGQMAGLGGLQQQVSGLGAETGNQFNQFINEQQGIAGGNDPRFEAFRQAQLNEFETGANRQLGNVNANLSRTGVTGSVAQNERNRLLGGLGNQRQSLTSGLGLQQMGRQDNAMNRAAGLFGQRQGMLSGLAGQQAGLFGQQAGLGFGGANSANQSIQANLQAQMQGLGLQAQIPAMFQGLMNTLPGLPAPPGNPPPSPAPPLPSPGFPPLPVFPEFEGG